MNQTSLEQNDSAVERPESSPFFVGGVRHTCGDRLTWWRAGYVAAFVALQRSAGAPSGRRRLVPPRGQALGARYPEGCERGRRGNEASHRR